MIADTLGELFAMVDRIGIKRIHYQARASTPHFDICLSKRKLAVKCGAIEVTSRELIKIVRCLRET